MLLAPSIAPPKPCKNRNATSVARSGAKPQSALAPVNTDKADDVEQFPAEDLAKLGEYRQERCDAEQIGERDPTHALQRAVEYASQGRQRELHDARVDLAHERANAGQPDDQPRIRGPAREERDRRRLRPMADEVADTKSRRRAQTVGAHPPPAPIPEPAAAIWMPDPRENQALGPGDRRGDPGLGSCCRNRRSSYVYLLMALSENHLTRRRPGGESP